MSPREHPALQAFATTAARFCALIESPIRDRDLWLADVHRALATLYAAAPLVLEIPLPDEDLDIPQDFFLSNEQWTILFDHLRQALGTDCLYYTYFKPAGIVPTTENALAPTPPPDAPVTGDLADDLADIYRDLKPGLIAFNSLNDQFLEDTLNRWIHMGFIHHWGRHAINALRALHGLVYK